MNKFSFKKGFGQVKNSETEQVKNEIMDALDIHNRQSWSDRLNGKVEPKVSEHIAIEAIFHKRGIVEIWGE